MAKSKSALERFIAQWKNLVSSGEWVPVDSTGWIRVRRPERDTRPLHPVGAVAVHLHGDERVGNPNLLFSPKIGELLGLNEKQVSRLYMASDFSGLKGPAAKLRRRLLAPIQRLSLES